MRIGLLLVCTGRYDIFLQPLIDSVDKWFFRQDSVTIYLFTDKTELKLLHSDRINIVIIPTEHKPFPYSTLYRYKYFTESAHLIDTDYVFYSDVDMRFVGEVDREILGDIVCVQHPGFYKGGWGSEGCSEESLAFIPKKYQTNYMAGGFQGGKKNAYLTIVKALAGRIVCYGNRNTVGLRAQEIAIDTSDLFAQEARAVEINYSYKNLHIV